MRPSGAMLEPSSMVTSVLSTVEQYCFPKSDAPFLSNGSWPSMTMIYSGTTLTGVPTLRTMTAGVPAATSPTGSKIDSQSGQSAAMSSGENDVPLSSQSSLLASMSVVPVSSSAFLSDQNGFPPESPASNIPLSTMVPGSDPVVTSGSAAGDLATQTTGGIAPVFSSGSTEGSGGTVESERSFLSGGLQTQSTVAGSGVLSEGVVPVPTSNSTAPVVTSINRDPLPTMPPTGSVREPSPKPTGDGDSIPSPGPVPATSGLPGDQSNVRNQTLQLSSDAVNALSLTQFLKHLGAAMFNASKWEAMPGMKAGASAIVANISLVGHLLNCGMSGS